tara:strand:+ start:5542 stop:6600 length:1059 start_codon:yes stop_codon:yes gene_type:complete
MKVALITDTHFGARNDNQIFHNYFLKFYRDIFFPYLENNEINTVIHLGDLVDKRKNIAFNTLNSLRKDFIWPLLENAISLYVIVGNHDSYYRNTNSINAITELFGESPFINIYEKTDTIELDGLKICLVPWICNENYDHTFEHLENTEAQIVMGHLEVNGFTMHRGVKCYHGFDGNNFKKFDQVFSGHFHYKSDNGHVYYLGTPYEMMWTDVDTERGFHIYDTETRELEFIRNPYRIHYKIEYKESDHDELMKTDFSKYKDCLIKVLVVDKNPYLFDNFLDKLQKLGSPYSVNVIEDMNSYFEEGDEDDLINETEDTITILQKYVNGMELDLDKNVLMDEIRSIYTEALNIQ